MGIRLVIGPIPAVLLTGGIIFAAFYPLSRQQHRKIVEELRLRREARKLKGKPALGGMRSAQTE
jgi:GPH family glycoside/pentoside/hexuronide:cation symporter